MIGERLQILRVEKCETKKEVASALKLHESTYGKYELGHRMPDAEILDRLANHFSVTVDYLLGRSDDPAPRRENEKEARLLSRAEEELRRLQVLRHDGTWDENRLAALKAVANAYGDAVVGKKGKE